MALTGARVDEKALAQRWQIGRTPLREASKMLAGPGPAGAAADGGRHAG